MATEPRSRRNFLKLTTAALVATGLVPFERLRAFNLQRGSASGQTSTIYDVRTLGEKGNGKPIDTPAINKAIETASAAGGGIVHFPAGTYACFSIHLKNKVTLYLDQGATILVAESGAAGQYDPAEPNPWDKFQDYGHSHWHNSLIWGEGVENVAILGPGLIWGKGLSRGSGKEQPK